MILLAAATAAPLVISEPDSEHDFVIDARIDIPLVLVTTGAALGTQIYDKLAKPSLTSQREFVDPPLVYGTPYEDAPFGRITFAPDSNWRDFSDAVLIAAPALALFAPTPDTFQRGGLIRTGGKKLVIFETLTLTLALTSTAKNLFQRPRPYALYEPSPEWIGDGRFDENIHVSCDPDLGCTFRDRDTFWSFPSGHTSIVTAAGMAFTMTELLTASGKRRWRWFLLAAPLALGGVVGYARVKAGVHRPSDVAGGLFLGTTVGLLVPLAHDRGVRVSPGPGDVGLAVTLPL